MKVDFGVSSAAARLGSGSSDLHVSAAERRRSLSEAERKSATDALDATSRWSGCADAADGPRICPLEASFRPGRCPREGRPLRLDDGARLVLTQRTLRACSFITSCHLFNYGLPAGLAALTSAFRPRSPSAPFCLRLSA